jgi:DUF971 family protein
MRAQTIKRNEKNELEVTWDDGHRSVYSMQLLRDQCPCAGCKGEVLFGVVYRPAALPVFTPGMYELKSLVPVGQYGVQAAWQDHHETGIYSWEYLRALCPCEECVKSRAKAAA